MINDILNTAKEHFTKSISHLKSEYASLQAGRANPAMVENILVDSY
jgi:ribosome recycling factor